MDGNYWGKYKDKEPSTHYDPLTTFIENDKPYGYRVNFVPGRSKRPREQSIDIEPSFLDEEIEEDEIMNSPLYRVLKGLAPCVPIAGDKTILGDPNDPPVIQDLSRFNGISVMNKFAPLGIYSQDATGVAMVNYPNTYTRKLNNPELIYNLLIPLKTSLRYLLSGKSYRNDLQTPFVFFNVGPGSGASIRYLHAQSYVVPSASGLNTYGYKKAFEMYNECLTCKIANQDLVEDRINGEVNYEELTIWEDDNVRVIYPHAPLRSMATRIIPKHHTEYVGNMSDKIIKSISIAISIADYLMKAATPSNRKVIKDRTISFRQTSKISDDFHMFIDMLPPFPFVAAETVDFLGLSPLVPSDIAETMRQINIEHLTAKM